MELIKELRDDLGHRYFSLYYNSLVPCIYCRWEGQTIAADIMAGSKAEMEWAALNATKTGCKAVINDCRLLVGSLVDTTDWATAVWSPAMYKSGIMYNAILQPADIFSQLSLDDFGERTAGPGHILNKMFADLDSAEAWLKSKIG